MQNRISLTALLVGVGLLWPLPVVAAVLMVAATFALVISWEDEFNHTAVTADPGRPAPPRLWKETQ